MLLKPLPLPDELKLESIQRKVQKATFDRIDLVIDFRAGKDGLGATVKCFHDAIPKHDAQISLIEQTIAEIHDLTKDCRKKNRYFRNLDAAWNATLTNPADFAEYQDLSSKIDVIINRLAIADDPEIQAKLEGQINRYKELRPVCSKQAMLYESYKNAREIRDEATAAIVAAEKKLQSLKDEEKVIAAHISDDHVMADDKKKTLQGIFPNIQPGFILTAINGEFLEKLPFDEAMNRIRRAKSPQHAEFRRYDYRFNPFTSEWFSLQELRDMGVCVEDPLMDRMQFIAYATKGNIPGMRDALRAGDDPDAPDLTGNTALVAAATNHQKEVVELLYKAGADMNIRDRNMMTPLLYCINRGYEDMVKFLLELGADRLVMDKNMRGTVFYSVLSGNISLVRQFLRKERLNVADKLWGFTALHLAANHGNLEMIEFLISSGCSIYQVDIKGRTPEIVAQESGHKHVYDRLVQERLNAPGQLIHSEELMEDKGPAVQFWIGDQGSLQAEWSADIDFTHIIYIRPTAEMPSICGWIKKTRNVNFTSYIVPVHIEDGDSNDNWDELQKHISSVLQLIMQTSTSRPYRLLICDDNGSALSPALLSVLMLVKHQQRMKDSLQLMKTLRPSIEIGPKVLRGLDVIQQSMDTKLMRRLNQKLRGTNTISVAF